MILPLRFGPYTFFLQRGYTDSSPIGPAELAALNRIWIQRIQMNTRRQLERALAQRGGLLSPEDQVVFQEFITAYEAKYELASGADAEELPLGVLDSIVAEVVLEHGGADPLEPAIQLEARQRLAERQKVAEQALKELL